VKESGGSRLGATKSIIGSHCIAPPGPRLSGGGVALTPGVARRVIQRPPAAGTNHELLSQKVFKPSNQKYSKDSHTERWGLEKLGGLTP
jgi:hypothetical protein